MAQETATVTSIHDLADRIRDGSGAGVGTDPEQVRDILSEALATPGDWIDPAYQQPRRGRVRPLPRLPGRGRPLLDAGGSASVPHPAARAQPPGRSSASTKAASTRPGSGGSTTGPSRDAPSWGGRPDLVNERGTASVVPDGPSTRSKQWTARGGVDPLYGTDIVTQQRSEFDPLTGTERVFRPPFAEADAADRDG